MVVLDHNTPRRGCPDDYPPPARTAAFSSERNPGVVFRVSQIRWRDWPRGRPPQSGWAVVATPERWQRKLRAVRSAVSQRPKRALDRPSTPLPPISLPSARPGHLEIRIDLEGGLLGADRPATTPGRPRLTKTAGHGRAAGSNAADRSPSGKTSSASAIATASRHGGDA